jgi:peptide/nickel transport system substrate-binding protein
MAMSLRRRVLTALLAGVLAALAAFAAPQARSEETGLRLGMASLPVAYANPFRTLALPFTFTLSALFEPLTLAEPETGRILPWLAVSWTQEDARTWAVRLREGVRFSDGTPMSAASVVGTFAYLKSEAAQIETLAQEVTAIETVEARDGQTVIFRLKQPDPLFDRVLSVVPIVEPGALARLGIDGFARAPVGTGPFLVERWDQDRIVMKPNPHAWNPSPIPRLEMIALADSSARLQGLLSGAIDFSTSIEIDDIAPLREVGGQALPVMGAVSMTYNFVTAGRPDSPFADKRVRQAMNYGVNKQAITSILLGGLSKPVGQPASPQAFGHDPTIAPYPHDPAKAKALLAQAGYSGGFTFTLQLIAGQTVGDTAIVQQVAADLAAIGVTMRIEPATAQSYTRMARSGEWSGDAFAAGYGVEPTLDGLRGMRQFSCLNPSPWYCDRAVQAEIDRALAETDLEKRATLTAAVMRRYHEEAPSLYLYEQLRLFGLGPRIESFAVSGPRLRFDKIRLTP